MDGFPELTIGEVADAASVAAHFAGKPLVTPGARR
jgi:hypothetical protein